MAEYQIAFLRGPWDNENTQRQVTSFLSARDAWIVPGRLKSPQPVRSWQDVLTLSIRGSLGAWVVHGAPAQIESASLRPRSGTLGTLGALETFLDALATEVGWALFECGMGAGATLAFVSNEPRYFSAFLESASPGLSGSVAPMISSYRVDRGGLGARAQAVFGAGFDQLLPGTWPTRSEEIFAIVGIEASMRREWWEATGLEVVRTVESPQDRFASSSQGEQRSLATVVRIPPNSESLHKLCHGAPFDGFEFVILPESEINAGRPREILNQLRDVNEGLDLAQLRAAMSASGWLVWGGPMGGSEGIMMATANREGWLLEVAAQITEEKTQVLAATEIRVNLAATSVGHDLGRASAVAAASYLRPCGAWGRGRTCPRSPSGTGTA